MGGNLGCGSVEMHDDLDKDFHRMEDGGVQDGKQEDEQPRCCNDRIINGIIACMVLKLLAVIGGFGFWLVEDGWTFFESIWFAVTLMTTVGYGSFTPQTAAGKIWLGIFAAPCIAVVPFLLNYTANFMIEVWTVLYFGPGTPRGSPTTTIKVTGLMLFMHLFICGGLMFQYLEGWSFGDSVYFSWVTLTTIGLGDFAPETSLGRAWLLFFVLFGLGALTIIVEELINVYLEPTGQQVILAPKVYVDGEQHNK